MKKIWEKIIVGNMQLPHRLAMSPMTRSRALTDGTPSDLSPEYYGQRASLGLIISEGTQPSEDGQGYLNTPGIYTKSHIQGWKNVSDRVHQEGGHLFIQLMHVGRTSHPDNTPHHRQAVAPSAVAPGEQIFTADGKKDVPVPRALRTEEIRDVVDDFRKAARAAIEAGADGVEVHGANGYLVHQFLGENSNVRTDEYGGSVENRGRFAIEVTKAVIDEIGADKVGFRISPGAGLGGVKEGVHIDQVYEYLVSELDKLGLAYLHVMHVGNEGLLRKIRSIWSNPLLVNRAGRPIADISIDIDNNLADIAPIGAWALANPDIVERLKKSAPLNEPDRTTFYGGDEKGYIDYPLLTTKELTK
ncbi:2,4-dienoyl-CoA reductase-like NADH-dependent reductase (Old Yellow Enzyme family) [Virgibacillus halotolerans]|uniref:alkene reductase n=1 Tax=Virgibacillus halotolerans TaxID=1071053 RepID=UPI001960EAAB|nr:alkene reductase [Virgibacillus halotolerans]MBM7601445.1 2,4-dienoyl-CoA reductase-like NADH-dependent reductase (Old Yellow Enzyme family) [Virgibacillus halotolerans]